MDNRENENSELQFTFAIFPESKKNVVNYGRSSGLSGFLNLPIRRLTHSGIRSETFL
jgi:hypothetical protein